MPLPANLKEEFATLQKSFLSFTGFFGGANGYALRNPDPTLLSRGGGKGLGLYEKVEEDCHASAVIQQRKFELISRPWHLEAASEAEPDQRARDLVQAQLDALGVRDYELAKEYGVQGFDGVALNFLDGIFKGYACGEPMWAMDGREVFCAEVRHKDQRRFGWVQGATGWELRLLTQSNWLQGEPIPRRKIIYHSPNATDANPYGLGLDSKIFWPVFFKRQDISFWLIFADKFGSPTPVGKYPAGASTTDKDTLLAALNSITQGMAATIPEGMLIEFLEATRSGSISTYEGLARYMDEQTSECVLGQTGTTNQSDGGGSRARDEVARTGMTALVRADGDLLGRCFDRTLIRWMVELNRPVLGELARPPHLSWVFEEEEDLNIRAERDKTLFDMGFKLTLERVIEVYGEGYEAKAKVIPPAPLVEGGGQPINLSDALPVAAEDDEQEESADIEMAEGDEALPGGVYPRRLAAQLADRLGPITDGWMAQVQALLEGSRDFAEFSEGLAMLYPELDKQSFTDQMELGLIAAYLGGAAEVEAE